MNLWVTEEQTSNLRLSCRVSKTLHNEKTEFQDLSVIDTVEFGRMLMLDNIIQTTIADEFIYHEMIAHVPLFTHPNPEKVLIVGGGDGGAVRETLKHKSVCRVVLVEIDAGVIEAAKKYLPEISCKLEDPRVEIIIGDGIKYIQTHKNEFDVIMIDSTDPIGPAQGLFVKEFYDAVYKCLTVDGLFTAQTESPFFNKKLIKSVYNDISSIFPITRLYTAFIPTYPGGMWTFTIGSKQHDPLKTDMLKIADINTRYYTPELHKSCFVLPKFVKELLR